MEWKVPTLVVNEEPFERNSCAVRTLSKVAKISYEEAHEYLRVHYNRRNRCATNWPPDEISWTDHRLGLRFEWHPAPERKNLRNTIMPGKGTYIVYQTNHVLPVIDGHAFDVFNPMRKYVIGWWRVFPTQKRD